MFWHFPHYTNQGSRPGGAIREGDWKLIEHYDTSAAELYDLSNDPGENKNLAPEQPQRVTEMRRKLFAWIASVNAQTNTPNPHFQSALYRELYENMDVSRHIPTQADSAMRARLLEWRRQMNVAVTRERNDERRRTKPAQ